MLRGNSGLPEGKEQENGDSFVMKSFAIFVLYQILLR